MHDLFDKNQNRFIYFFFNLKRCDQLSQSLGIRHSFFIETAKQFCSTVCTEKENMLKSQKLPDELVPNLMRTRTTSMHLICCGLELTAV